MTTVVLPTDYSALRGKTILITGCATGIGREVAKLAYGEQAKRCIGINSLTILTIENGANLALADINETDAHGLMKELGDERFVVSLRSNSVTNMSNTQPACLQKSRRHGLGEFSQLV